MASTNKTELLKLPQWQDNDKLEMTDLNDAFEKVDTGLKTHLAEDANKHIHSSGSNENGKWIKFDDGTMICTHYMITEPISVGSSVGAGWYSTIDITWTYPQAFVGDRPAPSIAGNNTSLLAISVPKAINLYSLIFQLWRPVTDGASARHIALQAVGRWKV